MSQFNAPTYDIERPTGQCAFTGRVLQPGEAVMSVLIELDPSAPVHAGTGKAVAGLGLKRLDVSMEAWQQGRRPDRIFSYWKSTVAEPNQKKKVFVDDDVLMNMLRRLGETDQPERLAFRFVLALILMRKRLLRYEGTRRQTVSTAQILPNGSQADPSAPVVQEWWLMVPRGETQPLEILNPQLDDEKIQQVTEQLGEILNGEL
jgi:hypothetical protein